MPSNFIQIVDEGVPFPWQYTDEDGNTFDTVFTIRTLPLAKREAFDKQFSKRKWSRGVERIKTDRNGFADACLDYVIVDWDILKMITMDAAGHQKTTEVPCEARYKRLLPELLKAACTMVTVGRDVSGLFGGASPADDEDDDGDDGETQPPTEAEAEEGSASPEPISART